MKAKKIIIVFLFLFGMHACKQSQPDSKKNDKKVSLEIQQSPFQKVDSVKLSNGELYRINNFKSNFVSPRNIDVWVPENYSTSKTYQLLLMHDGQMLFDSTKTWNAQEWGVDEKLSNLIKRDSVKPTIVVATWNVFEDRHSDYFPQKPFENLDEQAKKEVIKYNRKNSDRLFKKVPNSDNYLKFLVNEVIPMVETYYAVEQNPRSYTVAGSSMGGLISFYALCEYPDVFGEAICMSTHWPGAIPFKDNPFPLAFFDYLGEKLPQLKYHKFYFDFGTKTLDELYPPYEDDVEALFKKYGFDNKNFKQLKFIGDAHNEDSWRRRLHIPLTFILQ